MPAARRQRRKTRASPLSPSSANKPGRKITPSTHPRTLDASQDKPSAQKASRSRPEARIPHQDLLQVPEVPLSYVLLGRSRRGGRLRRLPATITKKVSTPAQGLCEWCTNRFHRLKPRFYGGGVDYRPCKDTHKSAQGGCRLCSLLSAGITAALEQEGEENVGIQTMLETSVDKQEFTVLFRIVRHGSARETFQFCSPQGK